MTHQILEKTNRRSPFNIQASNLRMVASSSMIVCSAMLMAHGSQASVSEANQPCKKVITDSKVKNQCSHPVQHSVTASPEQLDHHQWSDRFIGQLQNNEQPDKLPDKVEAMYADLLNQAQAAASRDQFPQAVKIVAGIPKNSQHYPLVQQLQEDWSRELVRQATNHCQQAEVATAIALVDSIPDTSQWHDRGTELKLKWSQQNKLFKQAIAAKSAQNWQGAIDAIQSLEGSPLYNSLPVQELLQQAMIKRYEPDAALLKIATADSSIVPVAPPETIATSYKDSNPI